VAENPCEPPVFSVEEVGLTETELRAMMVITVTVLCLTIPLRVALTKRPTVPPVVPAVNEGLAVVGLVSEPIAPLVSAQVYVAPVPQVPLHTRVAVNPCDPSVFTVADVGLTETELRAITVITVAELCLVTPLRVVLTNRPTVPPVMPALKVGVAVVGFVSEPIAPFVRVQAKVAPEPQVPLHTGVAVNPCVPPVPTVADVGATVTEVRAMIVITVTVLCLVTPFRVALTNSPTVPPVVPAVNDGLLVVDPVSEPIATFVKVHE
jgi:hypothetical protein